MKIINPKDFYYVLLKTRIHSKCSIGLSNPIKICPSCNLYFYSKVDDICPFCTKQKMMKNDFIVSYYELLEHTFVGINSLNGKRISFDIDNVVYFDNQEEQYFIVNI